MSIFALAGSFSIACSSVVTSDAGPIDAAFFPDATPGVDTGVADAGLADAGQITMTIDISNFTFSPANLNVKPGTMVVVNNHDNMPHSVTSQSSPGAFVPGSVNGISFDTGQFSTGSMSFTIPTGAQAGTVVPYFCTVHRAAMANSGQITIVAGP
jgi:plastocyanin